MSVEKTTQIEILRVNEQDGRGPKDPNPVYIVLFGKNNFGLTRVEKYDGLWDVYMQWQNKNKEPCDGKEV